MCVRVCVRVSVVHRWWVYAVSVSVSLRVRVRVGVSLRVSVGYEGEWACEREREGVRG